VIVVRSDNQEGPCSLGVLPRSPRCVPSKTWGSRFAPLLAVGFAVVSGGCGDLRPSAEDSLEWPIPESAIPLMSDTSGSGIPSSERELLATLRARLLTATRQWSVGTLDGPDYSQWGFISDVDTDTDGHVYVLDRRQVRIAIFADDGSLRYQVLREGDGPLEMRSPVGIEVTHGDTLVVHSASQVRFLAGAPSDITYARGFVRSTGVSDFCVTDSTLIARVASPTLRGTIQLLNREGEPQRIFGDMYDHPDPGVRGSMSQGLLACDREGDLVIISMREGPTIHAYDLSGASRWAAYVADFAAPRVEAFAVGDRGGVSRPLEEPSDRILEITWLPPAALLVQVARIGPQEEINGRRVRRIRQLDTYVVSSGSGWGLYVGSSLPRLLHATTERLFAVEEDSQLGYLKLAAYRW